MIMIHGTMLMMMIVNKYEFIDSDFGETVFFSKKEAEKKLKEIAKNKITKTPKPKDDWVMAR